MDKIVTVQTFSLSRFMDRHKPELIIALRISAGLYLLWITAVFLAPWTVSGLLAGGGSAYVYGLFGVFLTLFCALGGVKLLVAGTLQFMILRSLRSMQFAKTKRLCLASIKLLKNWPLVHSAEMSYFEIGLGAVCMGRADYEEAERLFATAVDRYRKLISQYKRYKVRYYPNMVVTLCHLSRAHTCNDKYEEAESTAAEALEYARGIGKINYRRMEIFPLHAMAICHLRSGALDQAENEYNLALKIFAETKQLPSYGSATLAPILMACKLGLAIIAAKRGNGSVSVDFWKEYIDLEGQHTVPGSPSFLRAYNLLASEYLENKMVTEAEEVLEISYSVAKTYFDHPDAEETLNLYQKLLLATGREGEVKDMRSWLRLTSSKPIAR